jgi:hypothetical protein
MPAIEAASDSAVWKRPYGMVPPHVELSLEYSDLML